MLNKTQAGYVYGLNVIRPRQKKAFLFSSDFRSPRILLFIAVFPAICGLSHEPDIMQKPGVGLQNSGK